MSPRPHFAHLAAVVAALVAVLVTTTSPPAAAAERGPRVRRLALVASSNDGGPGRPRLRFADSDAEAMARVLSGMGGVSGSDLLLLRDADRGRLRAGFDRMKANVEANRSRGLRQELVVYYSGHSDEEGLLLGPDKLGYRELRDWMDEMGVDVRIAILDSCASGALIRLKGVVRRPSFLSDESVDARGHAFLTASSASESAQESDRIGAAFFTHYLVSGLRGAADANRDGRVTLNEAYQFAYAETLSRTQASRSGPQHAAYDIQLAGTGDLVITDLRATGARLVFADKLAGRLYVRDAAGRLLVELRKEPLYPVEIGLEPGSYRVALDADGRPYEARVTLREGGRTELAQGAFVAIAPMVAVNRGGAQVRGDGAPDAAVSAGAAAGTSGTKSYRHVAGDLVLAPGLRLSGVKDEPILNNFVLGLVGHSDALRGVQLSLAGNIVEDDMTGAQLSSGFNLVYGRGRGVQSASLGNIALSDFRGAQLGAFGNVAGASLVGAQIGTVNLAQGQVRGAQIGVLNGTRDEARGAQVGVVNVAKTGAAGAQIGVVNYGGAVRGTQIGVVNVATDVAGAQIGVVNFARSNSGASIGVLPLVLRGYNRVTAWGSDLGGLNLGVKLGSSHVYTLIGAGLANRALSDDDSRTAAFSFGLGAHVTPFANGVFFDVDATGTSFADRHGYSSEDRTLSSLRLAVGIPIGPRLAVTVGPTYNVEVTTNGADARRMGVGGGFAERVIRDGETTVRLYPGFVLGVQL